MKKESNNLKTYIGLRIKYIRTLRHFSIISVAQALGITAKQLQNYEKGHTNLKISRLEELANIFDVDISYFLNNFNNHKKLSDAEKNFIINYAKIKDNHIKKVIQHLINELY